MSAVASQITSVSIVCSTVGSSPKQRIHQSSESLAFATGEFPAQMASDAENISIWWRHHVYGLDVNEAMIKFFKSVIRQFGRNHGSITAMLCKIRKKNRPSSLQWRHNGRVGVSDHRGIHRWIFRKKSK